MAYLSKDTDSSFISFRTRTPADILKKAKHEWRLRHGEVAEIYQGNSVPEDVKCCQRNFGLPTQERCLVAEIA